MVSKDQAIGGLIFLACMIIAILYAIGLFYFGNPLNWQLSFTLVAIPVFLALVAVLFIGAWIGWTMATTPPPKPIEELTGEMEEEKKEEVPEEAEEEEKPKKKEKVEK